MPPSKFLWVLAGALLVAALPMPYGYYQILRLATFGLGIWAASEAWSREAHGRGGVWALLALVYNPVLPIHFDRAVWVFVNLASALTVAVLLVQRSRVR